MRKDLIVVGVIALIVMLTFYRSFLGNVGYPNLSPPFYSDEYNKDISLNPDVNPLSVSRVMWDGASSYKRSDVAGLVPGVFVSKPIQSQGSYSKLVASWTSSGGVKVEMSSDNGAHWCTLTPNVPAASGCVIQDSASFIYRVTLRAAPIGKIDSIRFGIE